VPAFNKLGEGFKGIPFKGREEKRKKSSGGHFQGHTEEKITETLSIPYKPDRSGKQYKKRAKPLPKKSIPN